MSVHFSQRVEESQRSSINEIRTAKTPRIFEFEGFPILWFPGVCFPHSDSWLLATSVEVDPGESLLELFCGTGLVASYCASKAGAVRAMDHSPDAIRNAEANFLLHDVAERASAERVDVAPRAGSYDVIAMNPPYSDGPVVHPCDTTAFDPEHRSLRVAMKRLPALCKVGGRVYSSWASFADFGFFESLAGASGFEFDVVARLREPLGQFMYRGSADDGVEDVEFRIYRLVIG